MSYSNEVGERLRRVRLQRGLSLQEVERTSGGRWKAAVIGSYERGDRNISATRLLELAEFYEISPTEVLPGDPPQRTGNTDAMTIDLGRLARFGERYGAMRRYLESIQVQRGDFNRRVLSIRGEDLRALAVIQDSAPEELLAELRGNGVIAEDTALDGPAAPRRPGGRDR